MLAIAPPSTAPFIPAFSMSQPAGTRPSRDRTPFSCLNCSRTAGDAIGFMKYEPAACTSCRCRRLRSVIVSSERSALSRGATGCSSTTTRKMIHSGCFLKKLLRYKNVHSVFVKYFASFVFVLNARTESPRIPPHGATDRTGDPSKLLPSAQAFLSRFPDEFGEIASGIRRKHFPAHVEIRACYPHHERVESFIGDKDVASAAENDERRFPLARPRERFANIIFASHLGKISCGPTYLEGGQRRQRHVFFDIDGHIISSFFSCHSRPPASVSHLSITRQSRNQVYQPRRASHGVYRR